MTIKDVLQNSTIPQNEAELLLAHMLNTNRAWVYANPDTELSSDQMLYYTQACRRRGSGEPVAYICGKKEFFGREFIVNQSVLIPRPATEVLVEKTLQLVHGKEKSLQGKVDADTEIIVTWNLKESVESISTIVDIGTGSGCIGITLACEEQALICIGIDTSPEALNVAQQNSALHQVQERVSLQHSNLLCSLTIAEPFVVVSNPPYIPAKAPLEKGVTDFEPHIALFAGEQGTDIIEELTKQTSSHPLCQGIIIECREDQYEFIQNMKVV